MSDVAATFQQKAGPLPVWAWSLIIAVGGYVIYSHYKKGQTDNSVGSSPTTTDATGPSADDYLAAQIQADYTLNNTLGILNSNVGTANTAISANTAATQNNTQAITGISGQPQAPSNVPRYALVGYAGKYSELGKDSGALVSPAQAYSTHVHPTPTNSRYVNFMGSIYALGSGDPQHLTPAQYAALGKPQAVVLRANVPINLAPSKVR